MVPNVFLKPRISTQDSKFRTVHKNSVSILCQNSCAALRQKLTKSMLGQPTVTLKSAKEGGLE
jgi:hypothetical protein